MHTNQDLKTQRVILLAFAAFGQALSANSNGDSPYFLRAGVDTHTDAMADIEQFRYRIYVEEMVKKQPAADHSMKRLPDVDDFNGYHFSQRSALGDLAGCVRLHVSACPPMHLLEPLQLQSFIKQYDRPFGYVSKLMVARSLRGGVVALKLMAAMIDFSRRAYPGSEIAFFNCHPRLVPLYETYGFRKFNAEFQDANVGTQIPMYILTGDVEHFSKVRSPLVKIAVQEPLENARKAILLKLLHSNELNYAQIAASA